MTHWHDAGFGTDPEGDARRRAELETRHVDPLRELLDVPVTFDPGHVVEPAPRSAEAADDLVRNLAADLGVEAKPDPHAITTTEHGAAVALVCACGRWEAVVSGRGSAAWAGDSYRRHVADETRAAGG